MALGRRRVFWLWIMVGALLVALGAAVLGSAYVRDQAPNLAYHETGGGTIIMGCNAFSCIDLFDPTPWFVAGSVLIAASAGPFLVALRRLCVRLR